MGVLYAPAARDDLYLVNMDDGDSGHQYFALPGRHNSSSRRMGSSASCPAASSTVISTTRLH
jgi:hypothetical protein